MRYEPGVQTGITRSVCEAPFDRCRRISTSNRCVDGFDIKTVKEISGELGAVTWAPDAAAASKATRTACNLINENGVRYILAFWNSKTVSNLVHLVPLPRTRLPTEYFTQRRIYETGTVVK